MRVSPLNFREVPRAPDGPSGGSAALSTPSAPTAPSGGSAAPATPTADPSTPSGAANTSTTPPAPAASQPEAPKSFDFSNLGGLDDLDEAPDALSAPQEPAAEPAAATPTTPAAPTQPEAQTAQPQTPAAPAQQEPSASPAQALPEQLLPQLLQHQEAMVNELAATRFQLSQAEIDALATDPASVIPKIAAKVYFEAMTGALQHINNFVPRLAHRTMDMASRVKEAEDAFYGKFPAIDRTKHGQDVEAIARAFRAANPAAPMDELAPMVAAAVMAKYGLQQSAASAANGGASPSQPAFVPARPGVSMRIQPEEESPFAGLGKDFDDDA